MSKSTHADGLSASKLLRQKGQVMTAVILRDMRTRFFDHGLGYLLVVLWPLAHMVILLGIYQASGRIAPYGESLHVFFATGLIPTLLFSYISRYMCFSVLINRPMMSFPAIRVIDILLGRATLEVIGGALTLACMIGLLLALGDDPFPQDLEQAVLAYLATMLLAVGVGMTAGVLTMAMPFFATVYTLFCIIVYISSGTMFVTSSLPD